ncbi:MAG: hypothetical protein NC396_09175 [Bacteroides sp.]|nr:hypothetical protein [Bacteroides sp.]MCM1086486.1 hypothetical protein [Bacteroides sp.]
MKKTHWIILISLLVLSSCSKKEHYLTRVDKLMTPYQLNDTVYGIDSQGEKITLVIREINSYVETFGHNDWLLEESQLIRIQSTNNDLSINISVNGKDNGKKYRSLHVTPIINTMYLFNTNAYLYYDATGIFMTDTTGTPKRFVYDSLAIDNQMYHDIVYYCNQSPQEELYYNKTNGILQVKKDGKNVFTLQEYIPAR